MAKKTVKKNSWKALALILAGVLLLAAGYATGYGITGKLNPIDWVKKEQPGNIDTPTPPDEEADATPLVVETVASEFMRFAAAPFSDDPTTTAVDGYTLKASVLPAAATDKTVDYSIAWKNANSTWAQGKDIEDYLTITQATDGALTAILTCKKAFGEQAIVTVTSRSNPQATATATVDYRKRITSVKYSIPDLLDLDGNAATVKNWTWTVAENEYNETYIPTTAMGEYSFEYGVGTIETASANVEMTVKCSSELIAELTKEFSGSSSYYDRTMTFTTSHLEQSVLFGVGNPPNTTNSLFGFTAIQLEGWVKGVGVSNNNFNRFCNCLNKASKDLVISLIIDEDGNKVTTTYNVNIVIPTNGVGLNPDGIIF